MSSKLHIVGIGGTGHKVLASVVHLAACGAFKGMLGPNQITSIRVLTIDADDSNGNLSQARTVLEAYQNFRKAINGDEFGLVNVELVSPEVNLSLYDGERNSISSTFNYAKYDGKDEQKLIQFLYTEDEINTQFNQGFYGHTSIGTLVVEDILKNHKMWKDFVDRINENDFVIVIGSIFGGTGASAIPVVLGKLNEKKKEGQFMLAALMLTPYFDAIDVTKEMEKKDGLLRPDASNFHIKAKAALYYYHEQRQYKKTDALYIIGEPETNFSNEAFSRGSAKQRNKAHPIELFAATAILDFITDSNKRKDSKVITAEREADINANYYTWKMLQKANQDLPDGIKNFLKAAIFYNKILYDEIKRGTAVVGIWQSRYPGLNIKRDDNKELFYENMYTYFRLFTSWIFDIHKKNANELDQNTGLMKWMPDNRVKLFNINTPELFDSMSVRDYVIPGFDELIYNENSKNMVEKMYHEICNREPSGNARDFNALFSTIMEIIKSIDKKGAFSLFGKKKSGQQENFQTVPYLSKENKVTFQRPDADANKLWASGDPDLLRDIANGLPNVWRDSFSKDDVSIPSPWSIFIMNELTLREPIFAALNKDSFNQWCGLIALLALRKINLYKNNGLELKKLKFLMENSEFITTVEHVHLLPDSYIFDKDWTRCYALSLNKKTIAFLANNTFVCPAYSFDGTTKQELYKIAPSIVDEKGKFLPPDNYFNDQNNSMDRKAKYALSLFLNDLKGVISKVAEENKNPIIKELQEKVNSFLAALGKVITDNKISIPPENKEKVKSVYDIFELLMPESHDTDVDFPFLLEGAKREAALIGLNICGIKSSGSQAAQIFVTQNILYNQINDYTIQEYKGKEKDGILLLDEKDLLNENLMLITKNGFDVFPTLPSNGYHSEYQIVWPVSEQLLKLYDIETLNKMLSFTSSSNAITVTLTLKTKGKFGSHIVSKEYRIVDSAPAERSNVKEVAVVFDKNRMPLWAIWPYTRILDDKSKNVWKQYSLICVDPVYRGNAVFEIAPFFGDDESRKLGERKLTAICTPSNDVFYRRYNNIPVALKIYEKTTPAPVYKGSVFLEAPKTVALGRLDWNIGVDFGTTSTTAFYTTSNNDKPEFVRLMTEYKWPAGSDEPQKTKLDSNIKILSDSGDRRNLNNYFIDEQCLDQKSYTTSYEIMHNAHDLGEYTIFDTGRIFWHNYENFKILNTTPGRHNQLRTNIKWETDHSFAGKYLNQLMTQIVYQAAIGGAQKINWYFSYPTAFGMNNRSIFQETLDKIIKDLYESTGIDYKFDKKNNLLTESIAAAYYFKKQNEWKQVFLCLDIGGGTSDVSIWIKTKNIFQSSIRFASRDMFVTPLKNLLKIESVMDAVSPKDKPEDGIRTMLSSVNSDSQISEKQITFLIETVLFEYYENFKNRLNSLTKNEDREAYKNFKYFVMIAYTGLVYYLTNIIVELLLKNEISNDFKEIIFGLSGKGSKLTDWIDLCCDFIYKEAEAMITQRTKGKNNRDGLSINLRDHYSKDNAKTETAIGMVCDLDGRKQKNPDDIIDPLVYMGCDIKITKAETEEQNFKKNAFVDVYKPFFEKPEELQIEIDKNLPELGEFIEFFNRIAKKTRNDYPEISTKWYEQHKGQLWNDITTAIGNTLTGEKRFESPFIVMLKVFLKEYSIYRSN